MTFITWRYRVSGRSNAFDTLFTARVNLNRRIPSSTVSFFLPDTHTYFFIIHSCTLHSGAMHLSTVIVWNGTRLQKEIRFRTLLKRNARPSGSVTIEQRSTYVPVGCFLCRYYAIAAPLHYAALVSPRRVAVGLAASWTGALFLCVLPFWGLVPPYRFVSSPDKCRTDAATTRRIIINET